MKPKVKNPSAVIMTATTMPQMSDGYVGACIDNELQSIYKDLDNRGKLDGITRKLCIEISLTADPTGRIETNAKVQAKLPPLTTPKMVAKLDAAAGGMLFSPDMRENPDQLTIVPGEIEEPEDAQ